MTTPKPPPRKGAVIELDQEDLQSEVIIHKNLTQDVLLTTEDKMRLTLIEYKDILASRGEWMGAATTAFSFLASLLLSNFKDTGPLKATTWQAIYAVFFVLFFIRFISVLVNTYKNRKKADINYIIRKIKQTSSSDEEDGEQ
jgi:hypothetical protein